MSSAVVSSYGLAFSISPSKHKKKEDDEDDYTLTLAPFTKAPKISFGNVKVNTLIERNLLIINPQQFEVRLNVVSQELQIDNMELVIDKMSNVNFKIKWQPDKPDSYKYTIFFQVINNAKLRFLVHCYGHCIAPPTKKPARKPFQMLQPLKREKTTVFGDAKKTATAKSSVSKSAKPLGTKENKSQATANAQKKAPLKFEATVVPPKKTTSKTPTLETRTVSNIIETNQTFLVESIYNKPPKPPRCDIYNTSFEPEDDESNLNNVGGSLPKSSTLYDIRRQTCIIGSPRINKEGKYVTLQVDDEAAPTSSKTPIRKSLSTSNINSPSNFSFADNSLFVVAGENQGKNFGSYEMCDSTHIHSKNKPSSPTVSSTLMGNKKLSPLMAKQKSFTPSHINTLIKPSEDTPKLSDFITTKSEETIQLNQDQMGSLATQLNYDCTPFRKEPVFNKNLHKTPHELYMTCYDDAEESFQAVSQMIHQENQLKSVIMVQKAWRMKVFRRKLRILKFNHAQQLINAAVEAEKKKEELKKEQALRLTRAIVMIQKHHRMKMFRRALIKIKIEKARKEEETKKHEIEMRRQAEEAHKNLIRSVIICQRSLRMKRFRKSVELLKQKEKLRRALINSVIICQRSIRMKKFRKHLMLLKQQEENKKKLIKSAVICQKSYRMKIFRLKLGELLAERDQKIEETRQRHVLLMNRSAYLIQHQWAIYKFRKQMNTFRKAAVTIQNWIRHDMKTRLVFLKQRRSAVLIQIMYKKRFTRRAASALIIQKNWRMWREMGKYSYQMHQIIKIQRWVRLKADRLKFIALKRSVYGIQKLSREYLRKRNAASILIQRQYRMYRFRKSMNRYKQAVAIIQKWHHSMELRYLYLRKRTIICQIQALYRRVYMVRRHSAALCIQNNWRIWLAKQTLEKKREEWEANEEIRQKEYHVHIMATRIQACWRGYVVRKETGLILNSIRDRLSMYIGASSLEHTLGMRIRNSLSILSYQNVSIQQIIMALIDLEKVTRLSPECCLLFTREGAPETLYTFMQNCNRSVPHMDLIKFCLQIFINLAKYSETVCQILEPQYSLVVLSTLIQSYQSSNPVIFMDVCILFILMSQSQPLAAHLTNQENFVKKLQALHTVLERRHILKLKSAGSSSISSSASTTNNSSATQNMGSNTPVLFSIPKKGNVSVKFTMSPDWSLSKKSFIELPDQLSALEYVLNTLGIKYEKEVCGAGTKTPIKARTNSLFKENMSSSKSSTSISKLGVKIPTSEKVTRKPGSVLTKSHSVNFNKEIPQRQTIKEQINEIENQIADHNDETLSVCAHDMTVKSMASFTEEPKMNSTVMVDNITSNKTSSKSNPSLNTNKSKNVPPRRKLI